MRWRVISSVAELIASFSELLCGFHIASKKPKFNILTGKFILEIFGTELNPSISKQISAHMKIKKIKMGSESRRPGRNAKNEA